MMLPWCQPLVCEHLGLSFEARCDDRGMDLTVKLNKSGAELGRIGLILYTGCDCTLVPLGVIVG